MPIGAGIGGAEGAAAHPVFFFGQQFNCWEYKQKNRSVYLHLSANSPVVGRGYLH